MTWGLVSQESLLQNLYQQKTKQSPYAVRRRKHKRREMRVSYNREEKVRAIFSEKEMRILAMRMSRPCVCALVCVHARMRCIGCVWCCRKKKKKRKPKQPRKEFLLAQSIGSVQIRKRDWRVLWPGWLCPLSDFARQSPMMMFDVYRWSH